MPFGLTNAPATFQKLMSRLFAGKEWEFVSVYLDELLIASKSMTEHMVHVKKVLSRLKDAGLRLVAFKEIKKRLVSAPVLRPPDLDRPFILWTDASEKEFGAVLEQESEDGQRHPIAYASRATNGAERKYAPTELEVATLVFALEHFRVYLLGNQVKAYTDYQALVSAFIPYLKSETKVILARWYLRLSQYLPNVTLEHKPGRSNVAADAFSRAPVGEAQPEEVNDPPTILQVEVKETMMEKVRRLQHDDPELAQLMDYLEKKSLPVEPSDAKRIVIQAQKNFLSFRWSSVL